MRHYPPFHVSHHFFAFGSDGVDFIQKNDAGSFASGFFKYFAKVGFTFTIELVYDFRTADGKKIGFSLLRNRPGNKGFAASRGTVEENAFWGVNAQPVEDFRISQRKFDHFPDPLELWFETSDVLVCYGAGGFFGLNFPHRQPGCRIDEDRAFGSGAFHYELG